MKRLSNAPIPFVILCILYIAISGSSTVTPGPEICYDPMPEPCPCEPANNPPPDEWVTCHCEYGGLEGGDHCQGTVLGPECTWLVLHPGDAVLHGYYLRPERQICEYRIRCINITQTDEFGLPTTDCTWPSLLSCAYRVTYARSVPSLTYGGTCPAYAVNVPADPSNP